MTDKETEIVDDPHADVLAAIAEHEEKPEEPVEETVEKAAEEKAEEVSEEAPEEASEEVAEEETEEAEEVEETEEAILAPADWNKEDREVFASLSREQQGVIARREGERRKAVDRALAESGPLRAVVEEHQEYFRQIGTTPEASFRALVAAERSLRFGTPTQKAEALQQIARDYGIALPEKQAAEESDELADPQVAAIRNELGQFRDEIKGELASRQQADNQSREEAAQATAARFFSDLEAADPAKRPESRYIAETMPRFQELVTAEQRNGRVPDVDRLNEIFTDAAWSTPEVRARMQEDMQPKPVTRKIVKKSSSASGGSGAPVHSDEPPLDEPVRDTVQRVMADLERANGALR